MGYFIGEERLFGSGDIWGCECLLFPDFMFGGECLSLFWWVAFLVLWEYGIVSKDSVCVDLVASVKSGFLCGFNLGICTSSSLKCMTTWTSKSLDVRTIAGHVHCVCFNYSTLWKESILFGLDDISGWNVLTLSCTILWAEYQSWFYEWIHKLVHFKYSSSYKQSIPFPLVTYTD